MAHLFQVPPFSDHFCGHSSLQYMVSYFGDDIQGRCSRLNRYPVGIPYSQFFPRITWALDPSVSPLLWATRNFAAWMLQA